MLGIDSSNILDPVVDDKAVVMSFRTPCCLLDRTVVLALGGGNASVFSFDFLSFLAFLKFLLLDEYYLYDG